jgi:hypothetical protein
MRNVQLNDLSLYMGVKIPMAKNWQESNGWFRVVHQDQL